MSRHMSPRTRAGIEYYDQLERERRAWPVAVETLVAAVVMIATLIGALDLGRLALAQHAMDNAAYEVARMVAVPGADSAEALGMAEELLATAGIRGARVEVVPNNVSDADGIVTVEIELPYDSTTWCLAYLRGKDARLRAASTILTERCAATQFHALTNFSPAEQGVSSRATSGPTL